MNEEGGNDNAEERTEKRERGTWLVSGRERLGLAVHKGGMRRAVSLASVKGENQGKFHIV